MLVSLFLLLGCTPTSAPGGGDSAAGPHTVGWTRGSALTSTLLAPRGWSIRRTITHLHSPWSHDACDGDPLPDGVPDPDCLADLRAGLCDAGIDAAYLTDHPSHAADQPYAALLHLQPGDTTEDLAGAPIASHITCPDGRTVMLVPGFEGGLMPLGVNAQLPEADAGLYGEISAAAVAGWQSVGALPFIAHTEGRTLADLQALQAAGLVGVEAFNLHAMFDPTIRQEDLGLDGLSWFTDVAPFTSPDGTAEPDLLFLGVLAEQAPSIASWDALNATGRMVGIAGTDAHQNVLPILLRDGERGDSYRRMLRWLGNHVLVDGDDRAAYDAALAAGRTAVVFELLGTPDGFDFALAQGDTTWEMGSRVPDVGGDLVVACPTLSADSPQGPLAPEITATVYRDGEPWRDGCGAFPVEEAGVYRVRIDITPWHLQEFLGDDPAPWVKPWPWIYSNPIAVAADEDGT